MCINRYKINWCQFFHSHNTRHIMLPLKVYLSNAWMKSHTPIHNMQSPLRNHAITTMGVSLIENHHLIFIVFIKNYSAHAARPSWPCQSIEPEMPNGSTSLFWKGFIYKVWPFSTNDGYMVFMETWVNMKLASPHLVLNSTPKNIYLSCMFYKNNFSCELRLVLKKLSSKAMLKISVCLLASF